MYAVELTFSDDPARLELRPEHRRKLAEQHAAGRVVMAGPWADESGSMMVFDVETEDEVRAILDADPYVRAPGVTITRIARWNLVVGGR